jgi:riboflavin kinase/FMN adenylyltransferase
MKIYKHLDEYIKPQYPIVTVGTFDGVHIGHKMLLNRVRDLARELNGEVVLMTFHPHPRKVIFGQEAGLEMLSSLEEKASRMASFGVDHLVIQPFTVDFSKMEYDDFVRNILVDKLGVKRLVIGYDHQFGHQRKGSMKALREMGPSLGFEVEEIPEQEIDAIAVSSTRIRKALKNGEVEVAAQLLGYPYMLTGRVVKGQQLGRTLGFPTANLQVVDPDKLVPANGIYAVKVELDGQFLNGALSIGHRPTFDNGNRSIEVHILGFDEDIYGRTMTLHFHHYLRPELKFHSAAELISQMQLDVEKCLHLLSSI